jgi:hypothetical protein
VRSLAISAGAAVIAAVVIVLGGTLDLPQAVTAAGVALLLLAVVLAVAALVLTARLRTTVVLDAESITITRGRRRRRVLSWSMIETVRRQGPRLLLITKPEDGTDASVLNPGPATEATFDALIADIKRRLDADRGYRRVL